MKKKIFLGSSGECLQIVLSIEKSLIKRDAGLQIDLWTEHFRPGENILDRLISSLSEYDYAVFIYGPDDKIKIRGIEQSIARDNVIFESGLAMSVLGKKRTLIVTPKTTPETMQQRIASDLGGLVYISYEHPNRNLLKRPSARLDKICNSIVDEIIDLIRQHEDEDKAQSWRWLGNWTGKLNQTAGIPEVRAEATFSKFGDIWQSEFILLPIEGQSEVIPGFSKVKIKLQGYSISSLIIKLDYKFLEPSESSVLGCALFRIDTEHESIFGNFAGCGIVNNEIRTGYIELKKVRS